MAFTDEQKALIKELYQKKTNIYIANLIGCKRRAITEYGNRQGWEKPVELHENRRNFISDEDIKKMLEEYPFVDDEVLEEKYHISKSCIQRLATKFKVHKTREFITWKWKISAMKGGKGVTDEQEKKIIELYPDHNYDELEQLIGIGRSKIRGVVQRLELKKSDEYMERKRLKVLECLALAHKPPKPKPEKPKKEKKEKPKTESPKKKPVEKPKKIKVEKQKSAPKPKKEKPKPIEKPKKEKIVEKKPTEKQEKPKKEVVAKPKKVAAKKETKPKKTAKPERKIDSEYTFVPDEQLIRLCNDDELGTKDKKSTEPCIGKLCVCYRYCYKNKKERKYCDAYMYLK